MLRVGELVVYAGHGVCRIDDVCEKEFTGEPRMYYVLHPLEEPDLTIHLPTDQRAVTVTHMMDKEDAEAMIRSFSEPGVPWIDNPNRRQHVYGTTIRKGKRAETARVVNAMMRKQLEFEKIGKKFGQADLRMLQDVQKILFSELAISLETTADDVQERIMERIRLQVQG